MAEHLVTLPFPNPNADKQTKGDNLFLNFNVNYVFSKVAKLDIFLLEHTDYKMYGLLTTVSNPFYWTWEFSA